MPGSLISSLLGSSSASSVDQFSSVVAAMTLLKRYEFGKSTFKDSVNTPIRNTTDLEADFNPYSENAGTTVINKEWQTYQTFESSQFVFTADALELTANNSQTNLGTVSLTADVAYSRQVTIADASTVKIGQVIGLGTESFKNLHRLNTFSITNPVVADVITLTLTHSRNSSLGGFDPIAIHVTSAGVAADDAASFVTQINSDTTLQNWNITAILMPNVPGGFMVSWPKFTPRSSEDYGDDGKDSITWVTRSFTKVGSATLQTPQNVSGLNYVVSKSGNTLTLAHPVSLTTSSVITFNPCFAMEIGLAGSRGDIERIVNGDFSADSDWTKGSGWVIDSGTATATASSASLSQVISSLLTGLNYTLTYTVTRSAGSIRPSLGGTNGTSRSSAGTFTENITCGAGNTLSFTGTGFSGTVDNVSLKGVGTYRVQDVSGLSVGMTVQCSYQDSNLRRINGIDATNKVLFIEGAPSMQVGHWLTAYPVYKEKTTAAATGTTLTFAAVPAGVAIGQRFFNYYAGTNAGDIRVVGVTATTVTLDTSVTVSNGDTAIFYAPIPSAQIWSKLSLSPGLDGYNSIAGELIAEFPNCADIGAWPAFWCYTNSNDPSPTTGMSGSSEIDFTDTFNYWNNASANNFLPANSKHSGTAQSGGPKTITLSSTSSIFDGDYVGMTLAITGGTGSGQNRVIIAYDGTTKVATLSSNWVTPPNGTSTYDINATNTYVHPDYGTSLKGNNFGRKERRLGFVLRNNVLQYYLDGVLIREANFTWSKYKRAQFAVNLAIGSMSTSFNSNGFYPIDLSVFPMKIKVKQLSFWTV